MSNSGFWIIVQKDMLYLLQKSLLIVLAHNQLINPKGRIMLLRGVKRYVTLIVVVLAVSAFAAVDQPYEVGTWGDFAKGAVSFTFDDNTSNQLTVAQPMFDELGFHMTMFVVVDWVGAENLSKFIPAFKAGHEIASHTVAHNSSTSELKPSQDAIKSKVPGEMCATIAYPGCNYVNPSPYYIAGRICQGTANGKTPSDFTRISATMCGSTGPNTTQALNGIADQAASQNQWGVYLLHGMAPVASGESDYSQTSPDALKGCLAYLDKNRSKVWVETFGNVARYIKERDAASVKEKESTAEKIVVEVTDNLADSIYNFPLSIRRPLPDGWETAYVSQKEKAVDDTIITDGSKKYIMFKAVPNGGDVVILPKIPTGIVKTVTGLQENGISPVKLERNALVIDAHRFNNATLSVSLFGVSGKLISTYTVAKSSSRVSLSLESIPKSAFVAVVSGGGIMWRGMVIPGM